MALLVPAVAVLGAGPHGRQVAYDTGASLFFDDRLEGFEPIEACDRLFIAGALWPDVREQIVAKAKTEPYRQGIYLAPSAIVGHDVKAAEHVHVLAGAIISHGCVLDEFVTIATGAKLCGEVHVKRGAFIGAGAIVVHGGITIGEGAFVGAGMLITSDVPPGLRITKGHN